MDEMKTFRAKYHGTCYTCNEPIDKGSKVTYNHGRSLMHASCLATLLSKTEPCICGCGASDTTNNVAGSLQDQRSEPEATMDTSSSPEALQPPIEPAPKIEPLYLIRPETVGCGINKHIFYVSKHPQYTLDYVMHFYPYLKMQLDPVGENFTEVLDKTGTVVVWQKPWPGDCSPYLGRL